MGGGGHSQGSTFALAAADGAVAARVFVAGGAAVVVAGVCVAGGVGGECGGSGTDGHRRPASALAKPGTAPP